MNISFLLKDEDLDRAILQLHKCFFEETCSVPVYNEANNTAVDTPALVVNSPYE